MNFPIIVMKNSGNDKLLSFLTDFAGNAAIVAMGATTIGVVYLIAMRALGKTIPSKVFDVVPVIITIISISTTLAFFSAILALCTFAVKGVHNSI